MQYVLGVGFIAEKYRKNPKVRIFLDDLLVDEYEVENHKSLDRFLETDRLNYKFVNQEAVPPWTIVKKIKEQGETATWSRKASETTWPRHFKLYTIDDNVLQGKQHIHLEIENNDSNYTNGFMTRSTLLDLRHIFLLPKNFLKYFKTDAENFYKHIGQIIPKKYNGVGNVFTNHGTTNTTIEARLKGYPFPFRYNWQGKNMIPSSVGGSGSLILELGSTNKIITFKPFDDILDFDMNTAFPEDEKNTNKFLWNEDYNTKMAMRMKGLTDKEADYILNNTAIPAFPFSEQFFALAGEVLKDKYNI